MPSHYNCCVPLCTNHSRKSRNLSFNRIPKDESLRKEYTRLIRNKTLIDLSWNPLTLEFVPHILKEVRRNLPGNCRLSFHGVNPVKERKLPTRRGLGYNDVLPETHLAVSAEFEFAAVEVGVVKDITETVEKLKQIQMGTNVKSRKKWRSKLKYSKKKSVP